MNKSDLFRVFNRARKAARSGKLDVGRVNRALGVLQSKSPRPYQSSVFNCNCPDHLKNRITCKHMIAAMIVWRIDHPKE